MGIQALMTALVFHEVSGPPYVGGGVPQGSPTSMTVNGTVWTLGAGPSGVPSSVSGVQTTILDGTEIIIMYLLVFC